MTAQIETRYPSGVGEILLLVLLVFPAASPGAEESTPSPRESTEVRVDLEVPKSVLHHNLKAAEIRKRMGGRVAGFTRMLLHFSTQFHTTFVSHQDGERRFWVSRIEVGLAYRSIDVYLPREHAKGSCPYRVILEHEQEHIRVDEELVRAYAGRIREAIQSSAFPTYSRPLQAGSEAEGRKQVEAQLNRVVQPLFEELTERRLQAREAIDTPESFTEVQRRCGQMAPQL